MIDEKRKILFVHIPKCAGTYIEKNLTPGIDWHKKQEKHLMLDFCIEQYGIDTIKECYSFTIVRNPYERMVSFFEYHKRNNFLLFKKKRFSPFYNISTDLYFKDFSSFIACFDKHYNRLEDWAKNDIAPAVQFIKNGEGIHVDVYKLEEIESWLPELENKIGFSFSRKRINSSPNRKKSYMEYYTESTKKIVYDFYVEDFKIYYPELI